MTEKLTHIYYQYKWTVYLVIFGLLLVYAVFATLLPQIGELFGTYSEIRQNEVRLAQAADWATTTGRLKAANKKLMARLNESYVRAPQNDELSHVLALLSDAAKATDTRFGAIEPQPVQDFPTYRVLPIEIALEGRFHNIARFLNLLETSKKIVRLEWFEMKAEGVAERDIEMKLRVEIFELGGKK